VGLAILGSQVGGITDLVNQGQNGYLVPVHDVPAFTDRLQAMLNPQVLTRMKQASHQLAQNFDLTAITRRLEQLLATCAAASPKPGNSIL
jgi:glycosyltransferase involved in cell wall biosynthesis